MALVLLTEQEIRDLGINSFDPQSGSLGAGFTFLRSTTNDTNTEFVNVYSTNDATITEVHCRQTSSTNGGITTFSAYTLNKDV